MCPGASCECPMSTTCLHGPPLTMEPLTGLSAQTFDHTR